MLFTENKRPTISLVSLTVLAAIGFVLLTPRQTKGQWKKPDTSNAYYNAERVVIGSPHRGSKVDVTGSGFFTDFSDTINSTVTSGTIFNNSSTSTNGGYFHLGTTATDAYWGAATSTGGNPFSSSEVANSAIYFGNRDNVALQLLTAATVRMTITGGGNVGIGTNAPVTKLALFGTSGDASTSANNGLFTLWNNNGVQLSVGAATTSPYGVFLQTKDSNNSGPYHYPILLNPVDGNVGIGTTSPAFKLHVLGGSDNQLKLDNDGSTYTSLYWANSGTIKGEAYYNVTSNQFRIGGSGSNTVTVFTSNTDTERMRIDASGNVGIGTNNPVTKFVFYGASGDASTTANNGLFTMWNSNGVQLSMGAITGSPYGVFLQTKDSNNSGPYHYPILLNPVDGNVGVGTTSPGAKLDVNGSIYTNGQLRSNGLSLIFWGSPVGGANRVLTSGAPNIESQNSNGLELGTSGSAPLVLYTNTAERLRIDGSGTTTVTGNMTVTGSIAAKYQDVAEWVPSSEQLSSGTVVVLDSTKSNQVISSSTSYDTRVAGVISAQPGISLGEKGDGKVLVATTGRVKVKVDASKGPIRIGDLLVTSDVPGMAMRSEPIMIGKRQFHSPGTLIGKALEPLDKGTGAILVLLSLQ